MTLIEKLIASSSIGEGLDWAAFGRHLREARLRFGLKVSLLSRLSNLPEGRITEIEAGAPPFARKAEVNAYAVAIGVDPSSLESRMPK